jgi:hypothetical protein
MKNYVRYILWISDHLTTICDSFSLISLDLMRGLRGAGRDFRHDTDQVVLQQCQLCAAHQRPRYQNGKPTGLSAQFRLALARLLDTRLNPRAPIFIPAACMRRKRWQYVVDPVTKHLRHAVPYSTPPHKLTRQRHRKNIKKHCTPADKRMKADRAPHKSCSRRSSGPPTLENHLILPQHCRGRHECVSKLSLSQGRHRRHRRHRKLAFRGLPTPASSLYSSPRAPPPLLRHEGIAHDLEDHG